MLSIQHWRVAVEVEGSWSSRSFLATFQVWNQAEIQKNLSQNKLTKKKSREQQQQQKQTHTDTKERETEKEKKKEEPE